jgi:hypothetical protein
MSRDWTRIAGVPIDAVGFGLLLLLSLTGAVLLGAAWHFFPKWLPRRSWFAFAGRGWRRLRSLRWSNLARIWRDRRRARGWEPAAKPAPAHAAAPDQLPDIPAAQLLSLADQYAAAGAFREAVRERLRAITRQLVDRGLIIHRPEWTITELVRAAGSAAPIMRDDLVEASRIFSDIWYGERHATRAHDDRMRELAARVEVNMARPALVGAAA